MPRFRATVWYLNATVACVDGDEGITRRVIERVARDESSFKANIMDDMTRDVDDMVWFGPISYKPDTLLDN